MKFTLIVIVSASMLLAVAYGLVSTGPDCPGMDPSYIGWCK